MVTRDQLADREDKMLGRFEVLLAKHEKRMDEGMQHAFKVYGHDIADQLRTLRTRVTEEHEAKLASAMKDVSPPPASPAKDYTFLTRWGLPIGIAAVVGGPGTVAQVLNVIQMLT